MNLGSVSVRRGGGGGGVREDRQSMAEPYRTAATPTTTTTARKRRFFLGIGTHVRILAVTLFSFAGLMMVVLVWNQQAVWQQREAPLDHAIAAVQKPFWAWTCPVIPDTAMDVLQAHTNTTTRRVPIAMISARDMTIVQPVYDTWNNNSILQDIPLFLHPVQLKNTSEFSRTYVNTRCQSATFASRLFAVYQHVIAELLHDFPQTRHFILVEDDTVLINATRFVQEVHWAVDVADVDFYSINPFATNNPSLSPSSCVYEFSTTAQIMSRTIMTRILEADTDSFCRLPIDMFLARAGPWYTSVRPITKHQAKRLVLPPQQEQEPSSSSLSPSKRQQQRPRQPRIGTRNQRLKT